MHTIFHCASSYCIYQAFLPETLQATMDFQEEFTEPTSPAEPLLGVADMSYFEHQEIAIRWMLDLEANGHEVGRRTINGGILADDMGLGKTLEIAGLILNGGQEAHQTLIVAPLALLDNWIKMGHTARFGVWVFGESGWQVHKKARPTAQQIYVVNYDKLLVESNESAILHFAWDRVVLDEAHRIRNGKTRLFKACKGIECSGGRWAVTGTPIVNSLNDAVALFDFIGVKCKSHNWKDGKHIPLVEPLVMHRTLPALRDVVIDAPPEPVIEKLVLPFATPEEEEWYMGIQGGIKEQARALRYQRHSSSNATILKLLLRLRQISVHPQIYLNAYAREMGRRHPREWEHGSTKFEAVRGLVEEDMVSEKSDGTPHKYIFICHFHDEMEHLKEFLEEEVGLETVVTYDGSMSQSERATAIEELEEADHPAAILLQLQAGGVGLNLQCCDRVFFLSPWWTSALMEQAIARAVRMGQKEVVHVYQIALETEEDSSVRNIDRMIDDRATLKAELAEWFFTCMDQEEDSSEEVEEDEDPTQADSSDEMDAVERRLAHIMALLEV